MIAISHTVFFSLDMRKFLSILTFCNEVLEEIKLKLQTVYAIFVGFENFE